jgi:hypothetical protein
VKRLYNTKRGIERQGIHTFWRNYVSKLKKGTGGSIHASGPCALLGLNFSDALFLSWAPLAGGVFDGRSNQDGVAMCLDGGWASADVSTEED